MLKSIANAVDILKRGGVVAFPTETVYGLGARLGDPAAIQKIFSIKGRPSDNPLIVHIADFNQLKLLARHVPASAKKLAARFWPGPLTLVLKRSASVSSSVTAGLDTVAVRMPKHPLALELIRELGEPVVAPSANLSGRPSSTHYRDVIRELGNKVDLVLKGGKSESGLESTVVNLTRTPPRLLRPGTITMETLKKFLPELTLAAKSKSGSAASPGMKHRHYQPRCKVIMVKREQWAETIAGWTKKNLRLGVIAYDQRIPTSKNIVLKKIHHDKRDYARSLYSDFFQAEKSRVDVLLVESISKKGIGLAIMDRLSRASENGSSLRS